MSAEFLSKLHQESKEFNDFSKTGLASKISNLQNVYAMYLNYLEKSGKIPKSVPATVDKPKPKVEESKVQPKLQKKKEKPKIKEAVEVDDDMAFLDQVVQLNNTCAFNTCDVNISEISFNACRTCQIVFCPRHVIPETHNCDRSNPITGGQRV